MGALVPAFLAGLAALAVPVWIHLRHRERKEPVTFPSLMFLRRIPFREVRRQQIHHLPLFLLRVLALVLLVLAFTRPFLRTAGAPSVAAVGSARERVVLLDRSWSMGYGDRWTRAQAAARSALADLTDVDRATLVVFDEDAAAVTAPGAGPEALRAAIDTLVPGPRTTRFAPALKSAAEILAGSERPHREVVLITDFQRLGWPERDEVRLPEGTVLTPIDLSTADVSDLLVAGVELRRSAGAAQEISPAARVVNRGATPARDVPVVLTVNGRTVETRQVSIPAGDAALVAFGAVPLPQAASRVTVSLPADALTADDQYHLSVEREDPISVLLVSRTEGGPTLFLRRALELGRAPAVRLDVVLASALRPGDLTGRSLVILNDTPWPAGDAGRRLEALVDGGGGLLVVAGDGSGSALGPSASPLGRAGAVVDRSADRGGTLATADRNHPVFEVFSAPRSGDLSTARFFRYRRLEPDAEAGVLARFDDGAPALIERRAGRGRLLALAAPLDNVWSDLPVQPVFLPLVHQMAVFLAGWQETPAAHTVGQVVRLDRERFGAEPESLDAVVVESPSGRRDRLDLSEGGIPLILDEAGHWAVRRTGVGGRLVASFAANVNLDEADLRALDPEELAVAVAPLADSTARTATAAIVPPDILERRQRLWWYLIAALVLLLAAETVVANRLSGIVRKAPVR